MLINKLLIGLLAFILMFSIGANSVNATITETETDCGLFDCYTLLETSFNIPNPYIGNIYDISELPDTYKKHHIGKIENVKIEVLSKNEVKVFGTINGASKNLWGIILLGDNSHENSSWWNSSFEICRNTTPNYIYNDYQYNLFLNNTDNMTAGGIDLRIINASCNNSGELMPLWIEWFETNNVSLWFRGDNVSTTDYSLYYNYTGADNISNASEVFYWFDDFEDGSVSGIWTQSLYGAGAAITETGGYLRLYTSDTGAGASAEVIGNSNMGNLTDLIIESIIYKTGSERSGGEPGACIGLTESTTEDGNYGMKINMTDICLASHTAGYTRRLFFHYNWNVGAGGNSSWLSSGVVPSYMNTNVLSQMYWNITLRKIWGNFTISGTTYTNTSLYANENLAFYPYIGHGEWKTANSESRYLWYRIRKWSEPEPTFTISLPITETTTTTTTTTLPPSNETIVIVTLPPERMDDINAMFGGAAILLLGLVLLFIAAIAAIEILSGGK